MPEEDDLSVPSVRRGTAGAAGGPSACGDMPGAAGGSSAYDSTPGATLQSAFSLAPTTAVHGRAPVCSASLGAGRAHLRPVPACPAPAPEHPRMSMERRAAQFTPFAALTGYYDLVRKAETDHDALYLAGDPLEDDSDLDDDSSVVDLDVDLSDSNPSL